MYLIEKENPMYPQKLLSIKNPPDILFAEGNLELLNTFSLAIVGSRNYTITGKILTENLVKELATRNITIVSGMAIGIDSIAHESCVEAQGNTIAILGSGFIDAKRKKIFKKILENNGLIITEYLPDTPAYKSNFPRRNELISAISDGVIVTEAKINSGTLITANHAISQNKPLFTFPADMDDVTHEGNNYILSNGAKCILSFKDIFKYYPNFIFNDSIENVSNVPEEYLDIFTNLKRTPISINILFSKLNYTLSELQYKLFMMELNGLIKKLPTGEYILAN